MGEKEKPPAKPEDTYCLRKPPVRPGVQKSFSDEEKEALLWLY